MFRFFFFRKRAPRPTPSVASKKPANRVGFGEHLEDRSLLSAYSVTNLNDAGAGSLREALLSANAAPGGDSITFAVAGTISLTSGALPTITSPVEIQGNTAPGYAGAPVVEVDFNHFSGLQFGAGSSGSELTSLSLVDSGTFGVSLSSVTEVSVTNNFVGIDLNGASVPNLGHGIVLSSADHNFIGTTEPSGGNIFSSNGLSGISLTASRDNSFYANLIGVDCSGTQDRGNSQNGVAISGGSGNTLGNNVISANDLNGVLLSGATTGNTVDHNIIGLNATGSAALGNTQDGVKLDGASDNIVGHTDPVSSIDYYDAGNVSMTVSGWQGIRGGDLPGEYLITGTSDSNGLLYVGSIDGNTGQAYPVNYPLSYNTSVYGPDNLGSGNVTLVGSYKNNDWQTAPVEVHGFYYTGPISNVGFLNPTNYHRIDYPGAQYNYVHSTANGLVVGNYDSQVQHNMFGLEFGPGHAFIYDINTGLFPTEVAFPGAYSTTAYGIWYNGGTSYTLAGGYSIDPANNFGDQSKPLSKGYLVDYDSATNSFTHWTTFEYPTEGYVTHFEGISSVETGVYTLNADSLEVNSTYPALGSWVSVRRNADGSFGDATWVDLNYEGVDPTTNITSSNSVYGNQVVGLVIGNSSNFSFQATLNFNNQVSNVISANGSDGIELTASSNNTVSMNSIGTDITGTVDLGNVANGVLITNNSSGNMIGGEATGGNSPTNNVFVRPPQGNLISGNSANGVLITGASTYNQLSGNFIGTDTTGNAALGNSLDGVAIVGANNNSLLGCTFEQDPFVFYNVISANGNNGLRVTNSNDTTIQANFFGLGADNLTSLGNSQNGVLVEGTSTRTTMGGPIPLGNVSAANGQNGIYVRDHASFFVSYNTFCGLAAFREVTTLGNHADGMLITSDGGDNLIRTNVVSANDDDGIEISGNARGVRVAGNIIGLATYGFVPMGNADNGVEVGGSATDITIGGPQFTFNVIPHNAISSNGNNGVAVVGSAHGITINHSHIGLDILGGLARPNGNDGVYLGTGTYSNTIGALGVSLATYISSNTANGIEMRGSRNNTVLGTNIGLGFDGSAKGNGANGILIDASSNDNVIGSVFGGNKIVNNLSRGVYVASGTGNKISANSIYNNVALGIDLAPGANANQTAPTLTSVQSLGLIKKISGALASTANTKFTIEFFGNDSNSASGRTYLGSTKVTTNGSGLASYSFTTLSSSTYFTATATSPTNNTSEFSNSVS
jgi:trimeric autotransporter adhesin